MNAQATPPPDWEARYREGDIPWDTGQPSHELIRLLSEFPIAPQSIAGGRVLEIGCGTGTNAVHLAQQGFAVTAFDISPFAVERAKGRAEAAGVQVSLLVGDVADPPDIGPACGFVFDRGVYHCVRRIDVRPILQLLDRQLLAGGWYIVLAGNANDSQQEQGPPRLRAGELIGDFEPMLELVQLREFRFQPVEIDGQVSEPLGWSAVWRKR